VKEIEISPPSLCGLPLIDGAPSRRPVPPPLTFKRRGMAAAATVGFPRRSGAKTDRQRAPFEFLMPE